VVGPNQEAVDAAVVEAEEDDVRGINTKAQLAVLP
jgi:hypothetical protein